MGLILVVFPRALVVVHVVLEIPYTYALVMTLFGWIARRKAARRGNGGRGYKRADGGGHGCSSKQQMY